jgi:quercetin dioxygenase-like cupin family protein
VVGLIVSYPPNGATPPHNHGGAAVFATMIRGRTCMQMICPDEDQEGQGSGLKYFGPGESWHEPPGCHHVRSSNASDTEDCQFIATLIADTERIEQLGILDALVVIDAAEEEKAKAKG